MRSRSELPKRQSSNWLIGWKTANLVISSSTGRIGFTQVFQFNRFRAYAADDVASCLKSNHPAPDYNCHCGFNAFHDEHNARIFASQLNDKNRGNMVSHNLVMLRVGLYGRVIEGIYQYRDDWGYKAERQRVANVFVPPTCGRLACRRPAMWMGVLEKDKTPDIAGYSYLRPLCVEDITQRGTTISLEQCSDILKVPFLWDVE
jgi:hypothetical protein